jgi:uncharacterized lipoprotein NlpE involved in copper resistance
MKKLILMFAVLASVFLGCKNGEKKENSTEETVETTDTVATSDNSENSLDWAGTYEGTTPCADCPGIKTVLKLNEDKTYSLSRTYLGEPEGENEFKEDGTFTWNDAGSKITLKTEDVPMLVKIGENQLWMLDGDGNPVEGDLAEKYILKKKR